MNVKQVKDPPCTIEAFPPFRQLVIDGLDLATRRHNIHGLVEVDVTEARDRIRQIQERTGERVSFTGFIVHCCARAVDEDKHVHAYRDWRNRLLFDDVDVSIGVERRGDGQPVVLQGVIRAANHKSVREIHTEIRALQSKGLVETPWGRWLRLYRLIPGIIRRLFFRIAQRAPALVKSLNGTVLVTAVGMFGSTAGWGIPLAAHTLCVTVGGIEFKPVLQDGQLQDREHLCLTVTFDHDIVDGAPAARFVQRLVALVQAGAGLSDLP
jgi:pyruvate/2-oxoglutarate dehydrogenase complex dihydrolipoamide acyltransferase (E2) component